MRSDPQGGALTPRPVPGHEPGAGLLQLCLTALLALGLLLGAGGCRHRKESGDGVPHRDINAVMDAHVSELMAIPDVAGVAVGALDDGTPCILVLVVQETKEIRRRVPKTLEGHPVSIFVSGEIKPMQSD
jgi:hypothetical protein